MTKSGLFLGCAAAIALVGCGDSGRRSGGDAGGIVLMDSGPGTDGGPGRIDSGAGTDSGTGPRECEQTWTAFPAEAAPRCSAATKTCIEACTDGACLQGCIDADTTTPIMQEGLTIDCGFCLGYSQFYCIDSMGCHDQVAAYFCCAEDNSCADQACINSNCASQASALQSCAPAACGAYTSGPYAVCFP